MAGTHVQNVGVAGRASNARSYWLAGAVVAFIVFLVLGAAFLLDRRFRPPVGIERNSAATGGSAVANGSRAQTGQRAAVTITQPSDVDRLSSPLERDVARAYFRYWDVYGEAMESLRTDRLAEVTAGGRLVEAAAEVADVKAQGIAAKVQVRHSFSVVSATDAEAVVRDDYVDSSYAVDPATKRPVGTPGASNRSVVTMNLRRIDGAWRVVGGKKEST